MTESRSASPRRSGEGGEILVAVLETAYASRRAARTAIERALDASPLPELPDDGALLIAFVRAHLVPILSADLGPRLTIALLDDFIAQYEIRSGVRARSASAAAMPIARIAPQRQRAGSTGIARVLLVDAERIGRTVFARALLRAGCDVLVADSRQELEDLAPSLARLDLAIVDVLHPARLALLDGIVARFPAALLVLRSSAPEATHDLVQGMGMARFLVRPRDLPAQALLLDVLPAVLRHE